MRTKEYYTKLCDYLILNGYSKEASGLYYGKAGVAVGLFELSRYLKDERIEDHAFELLNQSLISKIEICDLETGLSGIAYALRYLIENEFVDADPEELLGDKLDKISTYIEAYSSEWQDRMNRLYSFLYAFGDKEIINHKLNKEKVELLWERNTEELRDDFLKIQKNKPQISIESIRRFNLWAQWVNRLEQRKLAFCMDNALLSETKAAYLGARNASLLISSPAVDYFMSNDIKDSEEEVQAVADAKSIQEKIIRSFCLLSDNKQTKSNYGKVNKSEEFLQCAFDGNSNCSSLKGGILQLLMYDIAVEKPLDRERLSEIILLPDFSPIIRTVKPVILHEKHDDKQNEK